MSSDTMTAYGYSANLPAKDPGAIATRTVPVPQPGPHDLLVRVHAVSVNPVDVKVRSGVEPENGFRVLGFDASGEVVATGAEVSLFAPGDEVFYAGTLNRPGTDQELHLVDERIVGHKPASLSHAEAAALPLTALTAWESLFDRLQLDSNSVGTLLIIGASGGVGSMMIQLARVLTPGVRLVATASNKESAAWVSELGAHEMVNHHEDLAAQVKELAPDGVDWLFTAHSDGQLELYAEIVAPLGHIVAIDDGSRDVAPLKEKSITWHWELMFTHPIHLPDSTHQHEILERVSELVDGGQIRSTARTVLSPINADTLREAHTLVEDGHVTGKVVVSQEPKP